MLDAVVGEKLVSVRLSQAMFRRLEILAREQKRSLSAQVALMVEEWFARQSAPKPPK